MSSTQQFPTLARARVPSSPSSSDGDPSAIEAALLNLYHQHHSNSLSLREQTEKAKRDAVKKAAAVSDLLVNAVNGGVQESFIYEKRIEMEIRALTSAIVRFMKQTDQWLTATHAINTAIKEIGDFENWMKTWSSIVEVSMQQSETFTEINRRTHAGGKVTFWRGKNSLGMIWCDLFLNIFC